MVDCHIHMVLDGKYWKDAIASHAGGVNLPFVKKTIAEYARLGYTYLRDGGDRWGVGAAAREEAAQYGITYRTPLAPLCMEGHYGSFIGLTYGNLKEYTRLVRTQKKAGADFIKIMISGLMDFDRFGVLTEEGLPEQTIRQLVHIAHQEGMAVMAHGNGARTVQAAAEAGLDSLEHGAYLDEECLSALAQQKTVWVPTLSTVANLKGKGRFDDVQTQKILESTQHNLKSFQKMGGLIAPGSDAGAWQVPHGCETEWDHLRNSGITEECLQAGAKKIQDVF